MQLYTYAIRLIRVIDGDTIDVLIDCGFSIFHERRVRLDGINCAETHGRTKHLGIAARDHLASLITARELRLVSHSVEKFGRLLGTIYRVEPTGELTDINELMVSDGHAIRYDGGKRSADDFSTGQAA